MIIGLSLCFWLLKWCCFAWGVHCCKYSPFWLTVQYVLEMRVHVQVVTCLIWCKWNVKWLHVQETSFLCTRFTGFSLLEEMPLSDIWTFVAHQRIRRISYAFLKSWQVLTYRLQGETSSNHQCAVFSVILPLGEEKLKF